MYRPYTQFPCTTCIICVAHRAQLWHADRCDLPLSPQHATVPRSDDQLAQERTKRILEQYPSATAADMDELLQDFLIHEAREREERVLYDGKTFAETHVRRPHRYVYQLCGI
jgi:hypothetical protein